MKNSLYDSPISTAAGTVPRIIEELLRSHQECTLPKGAGIFERGREATTVSILTRGLVKLVRSEPEGVDMILSLRKAPAVLGLEAFFREAAHDYTAVAVSSVSFITVPRKALTQVYEEVGGSDVWFQRALCEEQAELLSRLSETGCLPARVRLEYLIADWIDSSTPSRSRSVKLSIPLKDWEIAQFLCVSKEHVSRLLHQLQESGVIRRDKGWTIVESPHLLKRRVDMREAFATM